MKSVATTAVFNPQHIAPIFFSMPETTRCLANIACMLDKDSKLIPCDICLWLCPAGKEG